MRSRHLFPAAVLTVAGLFGRLAGSGRLTTVFAQDKQPPGGKGRIEFGEPFDALLIA